MVAMLAGIMTAGLGVATARAQTAPAQPQPTAPATADDPTATPYETAQPADTPSTKTTTTTTTTDDTPAPNTTTTTTQETTTAPSPQPVVVQPAAPVVVEQPAPAVQPVVEEHPVHVNVIETKPRRNMAISLGGGVSNFTDQNMQDRTGVSGAYEARLGLGMSSVFGLEAAYVGTAGKLQALGVDDDAMLISNGVEGLARLNIGTYRVQPYVVGGASWVRYNVVNEAFNTSDVRNSDDVLAIPFGGGLSTYVGNSGLMLDARFTYRATFDDDLIRPTPTNSDGSSLSNWLVTARVGYTF